MKLKKLHSKWNYSENQLDDVKNGGSAKIFNLINAKYGYRLDLYPTHARDREDRFNMIYPTHFYWWFMQQPNQMTQLIIIII